MPAIISQKLRIKNADSFERFALDNASYVFIGRQTDWPDENNPPDIGDTTLDNIDAFEDVIGLKRILANGIKSVVPRINWTVDAIYDQYDDNVDLINDINPDTSTFYQFYVFTDEFNVYKCLYNNNRAQSVNKPTGVSPAPFSTPDGYIWKYMYTVTTADAFGFVTSAWIPCYTLFFNDGSAQWTSQQSAVDGSVDVILVTNAGANYTVAPTVTVNGDGTGATATTVLDTLTDTIKEIVVTNRGSGYRTITIDITGGDGVGATARGIVSPIGGHGADPRAELGASHKMIRVPLEGDEGGAFPINTTYRRAGILMNPLSTSTGTKLTVDDVKLYVVGETVTGASSGAFGNVAGVDLEKNWLYVDGITGSFLVSENVSSQAYNSTQVLQIDASVNVPLSSSVVATASYQPLTGDLLYYSTRTKITRGEDQVEEARFIISF